MFEYYNNLPDYLPVDELKLHFQTLLKAYERQDVDLSGFIKSLWQLSDRQWHTYPLLDPELKSSIDAVISKILKQKAWARSDLRICRNTLTIIGNLGLRNSYDLLLTSIIQSLDDEKKQDVKRLEDEIERFRDGKVENLYFDLGKQ
jgi:hypothetical protein